MPPPLEARSILGSRDKNSRLGGTNEEKHQQPCWQLIHAFKQLIINTRSTIVRTFHQHHNYECNQWTILAVD